MWLKSPSTTKIQCSTGSHTCTFNTNKGSTNKGDDGGLAKDESADKRGLMKTERSKNFKDKKTYFDSKLSKKQKLKKNFTKKRPKKLPSTLSIPRQKVKVQCKQVTLKPSGTMKITLYLEAKIMRRKKLKIYEFVISL